MRMRAVLLHAPGSAELVHRPEPTPGPDEVVVAVTAAGLCGTDVHIYDGEFPPTPYPIVPGHEFAGRVVAAGDQVTDHAVGDPIAADCTLRCGRCRYCRSGRYNLCTSWGAIGDTVDGAFAEFVVVPAGNVYAWPAAVPHDLAPLTEPLACAVHAMDRLGPVMGARALVVGAGVMGALAGRLLHAGGASRVDACEHGEQRRARAGSWAEHTLAELSQRGDEEYDVVVDATGAPGAIEQGVAALAPGGRFLLLGVAPPDAWVRISPYEVFKRELTLLGSMSKQYSFGPALDLIAGLDLGLGSLLEPPLPLAAYEDAIERVRHGVGMKTVLTPGS
jgi:2-desacetyl-2-hydroxyethyl bacteriochlorophyllide A dehydrogenase